ncbi:MAG: hypothetical protein Aurels2KO_48240 [Aureliella sp.]
MTLCFDVCLDEAEAVASPTRPPLPSQDISVVEHDDVFLPPDELEREAQKHIGDYPSEEQLTVIPTGETIDRMLKASAYEGEQLKRLREQLNTWRDSLCEKSQWTFEDFTELRDSDELSRGSEIIEGLLRDGEVGFLGSVSKAGKSWLVGMLIWSVVTGRRWLGMNVKQGKVLLIDNELKRRELDWRHCQIARAMQHDPSPGELTTISRRGQTCDINELAASLEGFDWTGYSLLVIDAVYKTIPDGKSENDNEAMGKLMNVLQSISEKSGVAIMAVHHATKGDQSQKSTLDILSGAGSFGRSLDAMVALRDHEQDGLNVVEFNARTNPEPKAISAKFEWPLWTPVTVQPALRQSRTARAAASNKEAEARVLRGLEERGSWTSPSQLKKFGINQDRAEAALYRLKDAGRVETEARPNRFKGRDPVNYFRIVAGEKTAAEAPERKNE